MAKHEITKVRREPVRRKLQVASKEYVTPQMLRIHFTSEDLAGFDSPSPDDHIKLFFPNTAAESPIMRDFTPRAWDAQAGTFALEFALHAHGPAVTWARTASVGDTLEIGGPKGSAVVPDDFDWYLLVGDASALPSIARRLESLRPSVPVTVIVQVASEAEAQIFTTSTLCTAQWLVATGSAEHDLALLRTALEQFQTPEGDGFIWIATEAAGARVLYESAVETLGHPKQWVKAAEYWRREQEPRPRC